MSGLKLKTAPSEYPVTLADVREYAAIDGTDNDTLIERLIRVATAHAEQLTGRQFVSAAWELYLDGFPTDIILPKPPVTSITSIEYYDSNNVKQTLSATNYNAAVECEPAMIFLADSAQWPTTKNKPDSVIVTFSAGYGAAADVPDDVKQAITILAVQMFERRQAAGEKQLYEAPYAVQALLSPYTMPTIEVRYG